MVKFVFVGLVFICTATGPCHAERPGIDDAGARAYAEHCTSCHGASIETFSSTLVAVGTDGLHTRSGVRLLSFLASHGAADEVEREALLRLFEAASAGSRPR